MSAVGSIMQMLPTSELSNLRDDFEDEPDGLPLQEFIAVMLNRLPPVESREERVTLVSNLVELFAQVDVNGDGSMEWEEFTGFCIEAGMAEDTDKEPLWENYREKAEYVDNTHTLPVAFMRYIPALKKVFIGMAERNVVRIFDPMPPTTGARAAQAANAFGSAAAHAHHEQLTHVHDICPPTVTCDGEAGAVSLGVVAIEFLKGRDLIAISSADMTITLWKISGSTTLFSPESCKLVGSISSATAQRQLLWDPVFHVLYTVGSEPFLFGWTIGPDHVATQTCTLLGHSDMIQAMVMVAHHDVLVTAGMDKKIFLWDLNKHERRSERVGHQQGIRALAQGGDDILLSAGYDYDVFAWDLSGTTIGCLFKLKGHRSPLLEVLCVPNSEQAITVDVNGMFRWWTISRSAALEESERCLQTFTTLTAAQRLGNFHPTAMVVYPPDNAVLAAGVRMHLFEKRDIKPPDVPSITMLYNPNSMTFLTTNDRDIRIYDAITGLHQQTYFNLAPAEITNVFFCEGHRKYILTTQNGEVNMHNQLNGALMVACEPHALEISCVAYCAEDQTYMTTSWDRTLRVYDEVAEDEELLRSINNAHSTDITALGFSYDLSLLATGAADGVVKIWDYQLFTLDGMGHVQGSMDDIAQLELSVEGDEPSIKGSAAVTGLAFVEPYPLLVAADSAGGITFWPVRPWMGNLPRYKCALRVENTVLKPDFSAASDTESEPPLSRRSSAASHASHTSRESESDEGEGEGSGEGESTEGDGEGEGEGETTEGEGDGEGDETDGERRKSSMRSRLASTISAATAAATAAAEEEERGPRMRKHVVGVTVLRVVYDERGGREIAKGVTKGRYLLYTGDDSGQIRCWDLSMLLVKMRMTSVAKANMQHEQGSYNPRRRFERDAESLKVDGQSRPSTSATDFSGLGDHAGHAEGRPQRRVRLRPTDLVTVVEWPAHGANVIDIQYIEAPESIASCAVDRSIKVWKLDGTCLGVLTWGDERDSLLRRHWEFVIDIEGREREKRAEASALLAAVEADEEKEDEEEDGEEEEKDAEEDGHHHHHHGGRSGSDLWKKAHLAKYVAAFSGDDAGAHPTGGGGDSSHQMTRLSDAARERDRLFGQLRGKETWVKSQLEVAVEQAVAYERKKEKVRQAKLKRQNEAAEAERRGDTLGMSGKKAAVVSDDEEEDVLESLNDVTVPTAEDGFKLPTIDIAQDPDDPDNWTIASRNRQKQMYGHLHHELLRTEVRSVKASEDRDNWREAVQPSAWLQKQIPRALKRLDHSKSTGALLKKKKKQQQQQAAMHVPPHMRGKGKKKKKSLTKQRSLASLDGASSANVAALFGVGEASPSSPEPSGLRSARHSTPSSLSSSRVTTAASGAPGSRGRGRRPSHEQAQELLGRLWSAMGRLEDIPPLREALEEEPDSNEPRRMFAFKLTRKEERALEVERVKRAAVVQSQAFRAHRNRRWQRKLEGKKATLSDAELQEQRREKKHFGPYSCQEAVELYRVFKRLDPDGSGNVDLREFVGDAEVYQILGGYRFSKTFRERNEGELPLLDVFQLLFPLASDDQLANIVDYVGTNENEGKVEKSKVLSQENIADLQELFDLYDADHSGYVDLSEFYAALHSTNQLYSRNQQVGQHEGLTQTDLTQLIAEYDVDGDGKLSFAEFTELFRDVFFQ